MIPVSRDEGEISWLPALEGLAAAYKTGWVRFMFQTTQALEKRGRGFPFNFPF